MLTRAALPIVLKTHHPVSRQNSSFSAHLSLIHTGTASRNMEQLGLKLEQLNWRTTTYSFLPADSHLQFLFLLASPFMPFVSRMLSILLAHSRSGTAEQLFLSFSDILILEKNMFRRIGPHPSEGFFWLLQEEGSATK